MVTVSQEYFCVFSLTWFSDCLMKTCREWRKLEENIWLSVSNPHNAMICIGCELSTDNPRGGPDTSPINFTIYKTEVFIPSKTGLNFLPILIRLQFRFEDIKLNWVEIEIKSSILQFDDFRFIFLYIESLQRGKFFFLIWGRYRKELRTFRWLHRCLLKKCGAFTRTEITYLILICSLCSLSAQQCT